MLVFLQEVLMIVRSVNEEGEIDPEVELLNLACLDLVAQIEELKEELKKENARLKELVEQNNATEDKPEF